MTPVLRITRFLLFTLVATSLGSWAWRTFAFGTDAASLTLPDDGIVVVNFHATTRCNACREIGTEAKTTVDESFANDLNAGRLSWHVINFEEPAAQHFVTDYGLTTSTVVITRRAGGRDVEWQRLDGVWDLLFEGPRMRDYVKRHIMEVMQP